MKLGERTSSTRRTLDELLTQYELHPHTRDVIVEGREDAHFFGDFLRNCGGLSDIDYHIFPVSDRVDLPPTQVIGAGFEDGERGRVLTLAAFVASWDVAQRLCVTCIADADRAYLRDDLPVSDVLLVTDLGGLECYALTPRILSKFIAVVLRQNEPDGPWLLSVVQPILVSVFLARAALHISLTGHGLTEEQIKKHALNQSELDVSLVKRALPQGQAGDQLYSEVHEVLVDLRASVPVDDPRKAIRGHDIAPVIVNVLRLRNDYAHHETVERALMGCVERADIEHLPLFKKLVARIASAKH